MTIDSLPRAVAVPYATATNFSGNPMQPFSSTDREVPDVFDRLDATNSYHHAVRGPGNNPYCIPSGTNGNNITMESPWNQDSTHDVISCLDCHGTSGHGSSNQRMLGLPLMAMGLRGATSTVEISYGLPGPSPATIPPNTLWSVDI